MARQAFVSAAPVFSSTENITATRGPACPQRKLDTSFGGDINARKFFSGKVSATAGKVAEEIRFEINAAADKLRIGVIGCGRIGQVHAETIAYRVPQAQLTMVSDVFVESAQKLATKFGVKGVQDHTDILNSKDVDAVFICSPSDTHAQIIKDASAAGKHIFCEKPISLQLDVIDQCAAAVNTAGVKMFVAFQRRFDPNFRRLRQAVETGEVGEVFSVHTISRDPNPPPIAYVKQSGGIFLDMAIHDFDMLRFLSMSEPVEVYAKGSVRVDQAIGEAGDYDTAMSVVTFENGAVGTIDNCRKATYGYDQRAEVFGSKSCVMIANNTANNMQTWGPEGTKGQLPFGFFMDRYIEAYRAEVQAFVESVVNDQPVPTSILDGRKATLMALAAKQSAALGRPVKVSEVDTM